MYSRNRYLKVSRERYLKAITKKEKAQVVLYAPLGLRGGRALLVAR